MGLIRKKQVAKREEIIEQAVLLSDKIGMENMTIRKICKAAGISSGTFYHYFGKKANLIVELFSLIDDYLEENVIGRLNDDNELVNVLGFCKGFTKYVTQTGVARSRLINSTFPTYNTETTNEERARVLYVELAKIIERGQKKGQITLAYEVDELVDMIIVTLRGYTFDWGRRNGSYDLVEQTNKFMEIFIKSLQAE